jgi:RNA polymerase sigma factor (sigma-70 family)
MHPHPLIHAELARQSEQERRKPQGGLRKGSHLAATPDDGLALTVLAARSGSEKAWQTLIARFTPMLCGIVRSYRLNASDTDDVVQTVWASAFSHLDRLREAQAFGGWLCVIARREALRTIRKRQCEIPVDETPDVHVGDDSSPEGSVLDAEQREALHTAVGRLPDRQRTLLVAFLSDPETSYSDVSRALGLPVGAIGPTRARAIARLRRDRGLTALAGPR